MNSPRFVFLSRLITAVGFVVASAAVQAGGNNVYWSVNVDAPLQGAGRMSTSFSNERQSSGYGYREPAPVMMAPGRVYYREPEYRHHDHRHFGRHHGHRHGARVAARVVRNVHNGLARMHQDIANFHDARADAWSGGRRGGAESYRRDERYGYGRDERRGGGYGYGYDR